MNYVRLHVYSTISVYSSLQSMLAKLCHDPIKMENYPYYGSCIWIRLKYVKQGNEWWQCGCPIFELMCTVPSYLSTHFNFLDNAKEFVKTFDFDGLVFFCFLNICTTPGPHLMRIHLVRYSTSARYEKYSIIHLVRPIIHLMRIFALSTS